MKPVVLPMLHLRRFQDFGVISDDFGLIGNHTRDISPRAAAHSEHALEFVGEHFREAGNNLIPVLKKPLRTRANGAYVAIVSGGFRQFTRAIRQRLGADEDRANTLMIEGGKLTGEVIEPILGEGAKLGALKEIAAAMGVRLDDTLAVGDGANDLPMLQAAGLGAAYRAKRKVAAGADARVEHTDLAALLYAQGFARKDFVEG